MKEKEKEEFLKHLREQAELLSGDFSKGDVLSNLLNLGGNTTPDLSSLAGIFLGGKEAKLEEVLGSFLGALGKDTCVRGECDKECADGECQGKTEGFNPFETLLDGKSLFGGLENLTDLFGGLRPEGKSTERQSIFGALNVFEDEKAYVVTVALPGVSKSEISVSGVDEDLIVTVTLNSEVEELANFTTLEYIAEDITRTVRLENMDATGVKVKFTNGELTVVVPKLDVQAVHFEVK